jgi:hypothetical protein
MDLGDVSRGHLVTQQVQRFVHGIDVLLAGGELDLEPRG